MSEFDFLRKYIDDLPDSEKYGYEYALRLGKDESEITALETKAGIEVPDELREFYKFSYGADLGDYKLLTIPEILERLSELREIYSDSWRDSILPFACVIDTGDSIAFDLGQSNTDGLLILDCFHEFPPEQWEGICYGFRNWLIQMVKNEMEPFWL